MPVKDITILRTRFESGDAPSQQDFINLIDTVEEIRQTALTAMAAAGEITMVADQAARLTPPIPPVGSKVKQVDDQHTYIRGDTGDGTHDEDWIPIADAVIDIADVEDLQDALDDKLHNDADDSTEYPIQAKNFHLSACASAETMPIDAGLENSGELNIEIPGPALKMAYRSTSFVVDTIAGATDHPGHSASVLVRNTHTGAIVVQFPVTMVIFAGATAEQIPAGKSIMISVTIGDHLPAGGDPIRFASYAIEG
jgi:hypothetical protein